MACTTSHLLLAEISSVFTMGTLYTKKTPIASVKLLLIPRDYNICIGRVSNWNALSEIIAL